MMGRAVRAMSLPTLQGQQTRDLLHVLEVDGVAQKVIPDVVSVGEAAHALALRGAGEHSSLP